METKAYSRRYLLGGIAGLGAGLLLADNNVWAQENRMPPEITKETVAFIDQQAMQLVREAKLPPTLAAKLYSYLAVYQKEAASLARRAWGAQVGDLFSLSAAITKELFPNQDYDQYFKPDSTDRRSARLTQTIVKYPRARLRTEQVNLVQYPLQSGELYWYGENPVTPEAGNFTPWYLTSKDQFLPPTPPLRGYQEDPNELAAVWNAVRNRTTQQNKAVQYWAGGSGTETPAGIWLNILQDRALGDEAISTERYLEMRAVLTSAMFDGFISCFDAKYYYCAQRPNQCDPSIETFLAIKTPNFPSYTSGHSTISAAAAEVLAFYLPAEEQKFRSMAVEASNSRLWGGIHFPVDCLEGLYQGRKVGKLAIQRR